MYKHVVFIIGAFLFFVLSAGAQPKPMPKEKKLQHMIEELGLSSEQVAGIQEIYTASDEKIKIVNDKISEQHKKLMNEIKLIIAKEDEQILNLLNKEQKEKFIEMKKERDTRPPIRMDQEPRGPKPEGMQQQD